MTAEVKTLDRLIAEIAEKYEHEPRNWRVAFGKTERDSHSTTLFLQTPDGNFMLKLESIYKPNPLVVYEPIDEELFSKKELYFGFRPLSRKVLRKIAAATSANEASASELLKSIFGKRPLTISEIAAKKPAVLVQGPVYHTRRLPSLSEKQDALDAKLSAKLERLIRKEYPMYM